MSTALVVSVIDELVAELEEACREPGQGFMIETGEVLTLLAERAELLRDAGRYRWLRESLWYVGPDTCEPTEGGSMEGYCNENFMAENLDAAIDAAMQSEAKP